MSKIDKSDKRHVLSIYVGERSNKELFDHVEYLKQSNQNVSDFIKSAAEYYLKHKNNSDNSLEDKIRHIIETEFSGQVNSSPESIQSYEDALIAANQNYDD